MKSLQMSLFYLTLFLFSFILTPCLSVAVKSKEEKNKNSLRANTNQVQQVVVDPVGARATQLTQVVRRNPTVQAVQTQVPLRNQAPVDLNFANSNSHNGPGEYSKKATIVSKKKILNIILIKFNI